MEANCGKKPLSELVEESRVPEACLLHGNSRWDTWIIFFFFTRPLLGKHASQKAYIFFLYWGEESHSVGLAARFASNIYLVGGCRLLTSLRKR